MGTPRCIRSGPLVRVSNMFLMDCAVVCIVTQTLRHIVRRMNLPVPSCNVSVMMFRRSRSHARSISKTRGVLFPKPCLAWVGKRRSFACYCVSPDRRGTGARVDWRVAKRSHIRARQLCSVGGSVWTRAAFRNADLLIRRCDADGNVYHRTTALLGTVSVPYACATKNSARCVGVTNSKLYKTSLMHGV